MLVFIWIKWTFYYKWFAWNFEANATRSIPYFSWMVCAVSRIRIAGDLFHTLILVLFAGVMFWLHNLEPCHFASTLVKRLAASHVTWTLMEEKTVALLQTVLWRIPLFFPTSTGADPGFSEGEGATFEKVTTFLTLDAFSWHLGRRYQVYFLVAKKAFSW